MASGALLIEDTSTSGTFFESRPYELRTLVTAPETKTDEGVITAERLELIARRIQRALNWRETEGAHRLIQDLDSAGAMIAAFRMLAAPQTPERIDLIERVLSIHASVEDVAVQLSGAAAATNPVLRMGLCGALAAQVIAGNAEKADSTRWTFDALMSLVEDRDVGVRVAAVEALDRIAGRLPAALDLLRRVAESDDNDTVRGEAREALAEYSADG